MGYGKLRMLVTGLDSPTETAWGELQQPGLTDLIY